MLVDFWADWCGRCKRFAPVLEQFAEKHGDVLEVRTVNADHESGLVTGYRVTSLPTLLVFSGGKVVETIQDPVSLAELEADLAAYLTP